MVAQSDSPLLVLGVGVHTGVSRVRAEEGLGSWWLRWWWRWFRWAGHRRRSSAGWLGGSAGGVGSMAGIGDVVDANLLPLGVMGRALTTHWVRWLRCCASVLAGVSAGWVSVVCCLWSVYRRRQQRHCARRRRGQLRKQRRLPLLFHLHLSLSSLTSTTTVPTKRRAPH